MNTRYHSIDLIKGIAMIMVILCHYGQCFNIPVAHALQYCRMGCPVFFVASGFGIMCLINKRYNGDINKTNIRSFYLSRFKALAPGWYIGILIVYIANTVTILLAGRTLSFGTNRGIISIICNTLFLQGLLPFCNNNVMPGGWYIGTTVILYLLTPLTLKTMRLFSSRRIFFVITSALCIILELVLFLLFEEQFTNQDFYYYFFAIHYPEYLLGILLYYDFTEKQIDGKSYSKHLLTGLISLIVAIALYFLLPHKVAQIASAWATAISTYCFLIYMLAYEKNHKYVSIFTVIEQYGKNSYYIYLLHAFFAFTLTQISLLILEKTGITSWISFTVLLPIILTLSYCGGIVLKEIISRSQIAVINKNKQLH